MSSPNFIDYVKLNARSGKGGAGSSHFYRDKITAKGGPDGGDGGCGGHVILRGNSHYWTLLHLKYRKHIAAENGQPGEEQHRTGGSGKAIVLEVPLGTLVRKSDTQELLGEVTEHGKEIVILSGGRGGKGNAFFANSVNQAPEHAQLGEPGVEQWVTLELKVLADVGLIGFPNAGKSTLVSSVSAAKPKIADYPFTTLTPHLGVVAYSEGLSFIMADIPGIIEGAASGKGLGTRFLRHVERNSVLLFLIASDSLDIAREYALLLRELKAHNPALLDKQRIVAISKSDLLDAELIDALKSQLPADVPSLFISAVTGAGIDKLKHIIWTTLHTPPLN